MCGRLTQKTPAAQLAEVFGLDSAPPELGPRYNIAPTLDILAVPNLQGPRHAEAFRWGLVPSWAPDPSVGNRLVNARAETVSQKPSFRQALQRRRCLVLADGFYEWRTDPRGKTPFHYQMKDGKPFALAGLWEVWQGPPRSSDPGAQPLETNEPPPEANAPRDPATSKAMDGRRWTVCLLTTDANPLVAEIHDRMPVLLAPEDWNRWLDPAPVGPDALNDLLRPFPADAMAGFEVDPFVNKARNEGPQCVQPVRREREGWLFDADAGRR